MLQHKIRYVPGPDPTPCVFRDTNGWCPFCERVTLALEEKGIEYDTMLINLRDKVRTGPCN